MNKMIKKIDSSAEFNESQWKNKIKILLDNFQAMDLLCYLLYVVPYPLCYIFIYERSKERGEKKIFYDEKKFFLALGKMCVLEMKEKNENFL